MLKGGVGLANTGERMST